MRVRLRRPIVLVLAVIALHLSWEFIGVWQHSPHLIRIASQLNSQHAESLLNDAFRGLPQEEVDQFAGQCFFSRGHGDFAFFRVYNCGLIVSFDRHGRCTSAEFTEPLRMGE